MSKAGKVAKGPKRAKRPKRPKRAKQPKRAKAEKHHEPQEPPEASQPGPSKEKKVPTKKFPDKKCHVCDICGVNLARKYNLTMHKRKHGEYVSKIQCPHCHQLCSNQTNLKVHLQRFHERVQLRDGKIGGEPVEWIEVKTSKLVNGRIFGQKCGFSESSDASDDKNESTVKYMSVDSFDSSDDEPLVALIQAKGPKATKSAHAPTTNDDLNPSAEQLVEMEISVIRECFFPQFYYTVSQKVRVCI